MEPVIIAPSPLANVRLRLIESLVVRRYGLRVQSGPFAGLSYVEEASHSGFCPKILGCYEAEIAAPVRENIAADYKILIDVGCAEKGSTTLSDSQRRHRRQSSTRLISTPCRSLCSKLADINGVSSRVKVGGTCNHETLNQVDESPRVHAVRLRRLRGGIAGSDPVPALVDWDMLVELHDCLVPQATNTINARFGASHDSHIAGLREAQP